MEFVTLNMNKISANCTKRVHHEIYVCLLLFVFTFYRFISFISRGLVIGYFLHQ